MSTTNKNTEFDSYQFQNKGNGEYSILLWDKKAKTYCEIPIIRDKEKNSNPYGPNTYLGKLSEDVIYKGKKYKAGDIVKYFGGTSRPSFTIVSNPSSVKHFDEDTKKLYEKQHAEIVNQYNKVSASSKTSSSNTQENWLLKGMKKPLKELQAKSSTNSAGLQGGAIGAVTANLPEQTSSDAETASTARSFDFIDDILGTKSTDAENGNTDYDPNEVANNTVSNSSLSKIRKDTVNELVLAYSKAMQGILDNYGNKDMYNQYSRDSI